MSAKDPGGLKAMAKRNKLVGLQKLKFFCQMCEKQCRDENGFRCHIATEAHLRQMKIFSENATGIIDDFSKQFREGYIQILSQRHGRGKIDANRVYQEYIADKQHIHMNSTMWTTLSDFVKMLGRESFCKVEESETGWQIEYIDRDPKAMARAEEEKKRKRVELDEEQRRNRFIAAQVAAANAKGGSSTSSSSSSSGSGGNNEKEEEEDEGRLALVRSDGDSKVSLALGTAATAANQAGAGEPARKRSKKTVVLAAAAAAAFQDEDEGATGTGTGTSDTTSTTRPVAATGAAALIAEEERRRRLARATEDARCRHENWLHPGIVVKVTNRELGGGVFYGKKGTVLAVVDDFAADLAMNCSSGSSSSSSGSSGSETTTPPAVTRIRLDQQELETVIPKAGGAVLIVNGFGRGCRGTVLAVDKSSFSCSVRIDGGGGAGTTAVAGDEIKAVEYEDVCKLAA